MVIKLTETFFLRLPDDIWLVDLDSNKITPAGNNEELPNLPEPEGTILKNHLKQVYKFEIVQLNSVPS